MAGKLGGNNKPNDPDTVISPKENNSEYPDFLNKGYKSPPRAKIVTPEPPVKAVKNPHNKTTTTGVPPFIHPKVLLKTSIILREAPLSAKIYPAKVKRGIVGSVGETTIRYISAGIAEVGIKSLQKKRTAAPPNPTKIGAPYRTETLKIPRPIHINQYSF